MTRRPDIRTVGPVADSIALNRRINDWSAGCRSRDRNIFSEILDFLR